MAISAVQYIEMLFEHHVSNLEPHLEPCFVRCTKDIGLFHSLSNFDVSVEDEVSSRPPRLRLDWLKG